MKKNLHDHGFTLIELLVVIGIIAILASIVLAMLNRPRSSASDAKTVRQVSSMRSQAALYGGTATLVAPTIAAITPVVGPSPISTLFNDSTVASNSLYRLASSLPSGTSYYYAKEAGLPSAGARWFFAATTSRGTICTDWKSNMKQGTVAITPTSTSDWIGTGPGQAGYTSLTTTSYLCI